MAARATVVSLNVHGWRDCADAIQSEERLVLLKRLLPRDGTPAILALQEVGTNHSNFASALMFGQVKINMPCPTDSEVNIGGQLEKHALSLTQPSSTIIITFAIPTRCRATVAASSTMRSTWCKQATVPL